MKKQLQFFLFLGILAIFVVFFWNTEFLSTYLVEPIAKILWLILRLLQSVSQWTYWVLLIFASLLFVIRFFPENDEYLIKPAYKNTFKNNDRVKYWETLIQAAESDQDDRLQLQRSLQSLALSMEDLNFKDDKEMILLPPYKRSPLEWFRKAWSRLPFFQRFSWRKVKSDSELEMSINKILKSMEDKMELTND